MRLFLLFILLSAIVTAKNYKVYFLGGQSNMDGLGKVEELPDSLNKTFKNVYIFHGNSVADHDSYGGLGVWANLKPGHGWRFKSDGNTNTYSHLFGLELSFALKTSKLSPDENIAIIKFSKSGASIDTAGRKYGCFEPDFRIGNGINQYDNMIRTIRTALSVKDIDGDGEEDILESAGILWMQGESDSHQKEMALRYEYNLVRLMNLIRAALRNPDLPVVVGRISESGRDDSDGKVWNHGDIVRRAQENFVNDDYNAYLIKETDNYNYSDKYHYDSEGYIKLGNRFAEAVYKLNIGN